MRRATIAVGAACAILGCGDGADKTRSELGSMTADTASLSSSGDVRSTPTDRAPDSSSRSTSELRLRVRDREPLDPSEVRKPRKAKKPKHD